MTDHAILHGDCRVELKRLNGGIAAAAVAHPPYYCGQSYLPAGHPDRGEELGAEPTAEHYVRNLVDCLRALQWPLRDDGHLWLVIGDTVGIDGEPIGLPWMAANALRRAGWRLFSEEVVDNHDGPHDTVFLFGMPEAGFQPCRGRTTVLGGREDGLGEEVPDALFGVLPLSVARRCIELSTGPGDTVIAPFCGSGTVAVAARITGRRSVSIETDPRSIWVAEARLA